MKKILNLLTLFFLIVSFSNSAKSLSSSSYLIANAAISSNDYETASKYYAIDYYAYSNINELKKRLFSFVNNNNIIKAQSIANQIIKIENNDEDAWLVKLIFAKKNHNLNEFKIFESLNNNDQLKIIDFIFYDNNQLRKDNSSIANAILSIVQASDVAFYENKDYFLFYLNLATSIQTNFYEAFFIQAQLYQQLKNYSKAEKIYTKIKSSHSLYIEAQMNIAINKKKENKFNESKKTLTNLISNYPDNNSIVVLLADLYRSETQYDKAIELYSKIINKDKLNNELWLMYYMRGICYERSDNWQNAERDFLLALDIEPEQPRVLNYLAYGWIEKNSHLDESLKMLKTAAEKDPKSYYILDSLAWAHYKKKNFIKAMTIMEKVIEMAPGEAISLDHLGDIYFALGRKREAYFMWIQALDLAEPEDEISEKIKIKIDSYGTG